jgi:hypothetical protein
MRLTHGWPTANRLAAEGADHGAAIEDLLYEDLSCKKRALFLFTMVSVAHQRKEAPVISPSTRGQAMCGRALGMPEIVNAGLAQVARRIHKRFTPDELKQDPKLRRIRPDCIYDAHEGP